jgi:glutaredoxin/glutathione-dependent peroxiredoxin
MAIKVGDRLPDATFRTPGADGPQTLSTAEIFGGKKVVLFGVPGAFTPTCSNNHLPGYLQHGDAIRAKGVDAIAVVATNDAHVMRAWGEHAGVAGRIMLLSDGNADFAKAIGLDNDSSVFGMGTRFKRFSMLVEDGVVKSLAVEETPREAKVSGAEAMLASL